MSIYALRVNGFEKEVYNSLITEGVARFTWSYCEEGNLKRILEKAESIGWNSLTENERGCWKANFMLKIKPEDYVVYINVPSYGQCTVAKVTSEYFWGWEKYKSDGSHCLKIDKNSVRTFKRNDENIPSDLNRRFNLQGKYWRIYLEDKFYTLLQDLNNGKLEGIDATSESRLKKCIDEKINPYLDEVCKALQEHHVGKHLEGLIAKILEEIPEVKGVSQKSGRGDKGGDILFDYEVTDIFGHYSTQKCAIQVKSYEKEIDYTKAIEDMRNIFNYESDLDYGIIMTTAIDVTENFKKELLKLNDELNKSSTENEKKHVEILYGRDFVRWVLKYGEKYFTKIK